MYATALPVLRVQNAWTVEFAKPAAWTVLGAITASAVPFPAGFVLNVAVVIGIAVAVQVVAGEGEMCSVTVYVVFAIAVEDGPVGTAAAA